MDTQSTPAPDMPEIRSRQRRSSTIRSILGRHRHFSSRATGGWPLGYEERRCCANCPCN